MIRSFYVIFLMCLVSTASAQAKSAVTAHDAPPAIGAPIPDTFAWCPKGRDCLCFEPLDCKGSACSTIKSHLAEMQKLLKGKRKGQSFVCAYAETGTCGAWTYIYCDIGESQGTRLRLFDDTGHLAAAKWQSDYGEFCEGKARTLYMGQIPKCTPLTRTKVIFGKGTSPTAPAVESWK